MEMHRLDVNLLEAFVDRIIYLNASQECTRKDVVAGIKSVCSLEGYNIEEIGNLEYATYFCRYSYKISFNEETVLVSISDTCVDDRFGFGVEFFIAESKRSVSRTFVELLDTKDVMISKLKIAISKF